MMRKTIKLRIIGNRRMEIGKWLGTNIRNTNRENTNAIYEKKGKVRHSKQKEL